MSNLTVSVPETPKLRSLNGATAFALSDSVTLTCAADGGSDFQFQKGSAGNIQIVQAFSSSSTFTINSFSAVDADTYTCITRNGAVEAKAGGHLTLNLSELLLPLIFCAQIQGLTSFLLRKRNNSQLFYEFCK